MFDTKADAWQKLGNTVILLHETPIYITGCEEQENKVILNYLALPAKESKFQTVVLDEKDIDFRSLGSRLGYMNMDGNKDTRQAVFVSRAPKRQSVQGINGSNLVFTSLVDPKTGMKFQPGWTFVYKTEDFSNMLKGKYPSMKEAAKTILQDDAVLSIAFAKWFAFRKKSVGPLYLEYKGREIGWSPDLKKINLSKTFTHLQETLEYYDIPFELTGT